MPTYTFLNIDTNEVEEHIVSISKYDQFKLDNPHLQRHFEKGETASFGDPVRLGLKKPDSGFRDVLKEVRKKHDAKFTRSTINTH